MSTPATIEEILVSKLEKIFGLKKITMYAPGENYEQDILFVEVTRNKSTMSKGMISYNISGNIKIHSQIEKVPFGFFLKKIDQAKRADKEGFFFHSFDENSSFVQDHVERKVSFLYLANMQYDPDKGEINELTLEYT